MASPIHASNAGVKVKEVEYADLAAQHVEPCISIYTSDCWARNGARHCLPRLKSLLRTAELKLQDTSMAAEEAQSLLTSNWRLIEETEPSFANAQGLAIFMSRAFFGFCHLPVPVASQVAVGRQFLLRPLLSLIWMEDRFFVLALSQKHVRLLESSRRGISERIMHEVPESLHEDLEGLHFERQYQMHTAASLGTHQKGAIFHGPSVSQKDRLIHFFRDVDRGVADSLKGQEKPLIVAAVDYLFPIYKEANTYPHLLDEMIDGSPDLLSPNALHAAAWKILEDQAASLPCRSEASESLCDHSHWPRGGATRTMSHCSGTQSRNSSRHGRVAGPDSPSCHFFTLTSMTKVNSESPAFPVLIQAYLSDAARGVRLRCVDPGADSRAWLHHDFGTLRPPVGGCGFGSDF